MGKQKLNIICGIFAIIILIVNVPAIAENGISDNIVISEYYSAVGCGKWYESSFLSADYYMNLCATETRSIKRGIANVYAADNLHIISELTCRDYDIYTQDIENPRLYLVSVDEKTYSDDGFNFSGTNYQIVICGEEQGRRVVCDVRLPLPHTVTDYVDIQSANQYFSMRFNIPMTRAYTHADIPRDYEFKPETIRVKRFHRDEKKDSEIETVDFKQYTYVVLCGEMCPYRGNDYTQAQLEYCKASAVAARNFGWYKYLSSGANYDFHIYDCSGASSHGHPSISPKPADQLYLPEKHGNPDSGHALAPLTIRAVDEIWDDIFVNDEYKLFLSICANGKYNDDYKHAGKLRHQGSKYLAEKLGMNYKEILHYYYDYVDPDGSTVVGNGGKVHIYPLGDAGMNEEFNTNDAVWILRFAAGINKADSIAAKFKLRKILADNNTDGAINTIDAVRMLRILAGMSPDYIPPENPPENTPEPTSEPTPEPTPEETPELSPDNP